MKTDRKGGSCMEEKKPFLLKLFGIALTAAAVFFLLRRTFGALVPFLVGFGAAALIHPLVRALNGRFGMKPRPTAVLLTLFFWMTLGALSAVLTVRAAVRLGGWSTRLPELYADRLEPALTELFDRLSRFTAKLDEKLGGGLSDTLGGLFGSLRDSLGAAVSELSVTALAKLSASAAKIPRVIVGFVFAVLSSFFFAADFDGITAFAAKKLPPRALGVLKELGSRFLTAARSFLRSYSLLFLMTLGELSLGFCLLRAEKPFGTAIFIAFFDILPVFGTGGILLPWALLSFLTGKDGFGIGLLILWGVVSLVRNIAEPRIVGRQVGLHPLAALMAMYIGTKLFGLWGLFLAPTALAVVLPLLDRPAQTEPSDEGLSNRTTS